MVDVDAGRLSQRVDIQSVTETLDGSGGISEAWATDASRWASIEPISGEDLQVADQLEGIVTHRIRVRATSAVDRTKRFLKGSRAFYIVSVRDFDDMGVLMECMCREQLA